MTQRTAQLTLRLLGLAWRADALMLTCYLGTALIIGFLPLLGTIVDQRLLNAFVRVDPLRTAEGSLLIVASLLVTRSLLDVSENFLRWGYNGSYLAQLMQNRLQSASTLLLCHKLSALDMGHLESPEFQNLLSTTRSTYLWRMTGILRAFAILLVNCIGWIGSMILLVSFGWWIPLVLLAATVPRLMQQRRQGVGVWSMRNAKAPESKKLTYMSNLLTSTKTIPEIQIFRSAPLLFERFNQIQERLYEANRRVLKRHLRTQWIPPLIECASSLCIASLWLGEALNGSLPVGTFVLLLSLCERVTATTGQMVTNFSGIQTDALFAKSFFEILDLPVLIKDPEQPVTLKIERPPRIEFRNVSFAYQNGTPVLHQLSFTIEPGESLALVGINGAGKSTIIKLLCRFYDATEGEILVEGHNIRDLARIDWYRYLGTLFQQFVHFEFTVRDNIMLGSPEKRDEEAMRNAARLAHAEEFIEKLPLKYDQQLGVQFEKGNELSQGQWQKLAIARAFYQSAPILILDEPTSAVDAESEFPIFNNLREHYTGKTIIFVSHKFSTVRTAAKILVLENGRIQEEGNHDELLALNGRYAATFKAQASGYQ